MALAEFQTSKLQNAPDGAQSAELSEPRDRRLAGAQGGGLHASTLASRIAAGILMYIGVFVKYHKLGIMTGADGGYILGDQRVYPDVAYMSYRRQPNPVNADCNPLAPDLAVEVIMPTDGASSTLDKVATYLAAGTTVWMIDPTLHTALVFAPGAVPTVFRRNDVLTGGNVLPGFTLPLGELFEELG